VAEAADPVIPDAELARSDPELHRKLTAAGQGFTLGHFSAQPEPFLTQNTL